MDGTTDVTRTFHYGTPTTRQVFQNDLNYSKIIFKITPKIIQIIQKK
jgi:Xaa-Pro aminopeptidase